MAALYEVSVIATNQTKPHVNVFAFYDDNDNVDLADLADYMEGFFCVPVLPWVTTQFVYTSIEIKSLSAGTPATHQKTIFQQGQSVVDPMPTGVHLNIKLGSADQGFRAGNKLQGGLVEDEFSGGNATNATMDIFQVIYNGVLTGSNSAVGVVQAIYRPAFSFPGIPAFSLVQSVLVRGNSTTSRRDEDFAR